MVEFCSYIQEGTYSLKLNLKIYLGKKNLLVIKINMDIFYFDNTSLSVCEA